MAIRRNSVYNLGIYVLIAQKLVKENKALRKEITEMSSYILNLEFKTLGGA